MNENEFYLQKAKEWFAKGDHDVQTAKILLADPKSPTDTLCFHCQQAAEKYLKGILTLNNIDFIKTHDLEYLLKLCKNILKGIENYEDGILALNKYSIESRYPMDLPVFYSLNEAKEAFKIAREIIEFIRNALNL